MNKAVVGFRILHRIVRELRLKLLTHEGLFLGVSPGNKRHLVGAGAGVNLQQEILVGREHDRPQRNSLGAIRRLGGIGGVSRIHGLRPFTHSMSLVGESD